MRPAYFDLSVHDINQTRAFFEHVFDWRFEKFPASNAYYRIHTGPADEPGIDGRIGQLAEAPMLGGKPMTIMAISVQNIDQAISSVLSNGGQVIEPKMHMPEIGWYTTCAEPGGLLFGMIQPYQPPE
jgi:predicted enzyme related to lactoylglutathione lyase